MRSNGNMLFVDDEGKGCDSQELAPDCCLAPVCHGFTKQSQTPSIKVML